MSLLPIGAIRDAVHERSDKTALASERYSVEEAPDLAAFDLGHRLLEAQFGPVGEIERREVLERWFQLKSFTPPGMTLKPIYHFLLFRDRDGKVAAVRDGWTVVDVPGRRAAVFLSHSLVVPEHRRTGVAALLRAAPVVLARRAAEAAGVADASVLLFAEMEPVDPTATATVVRYLSYGRAGFGVVPPSSAPYAQPDFRDLGALGETAVPLPMMLVVRQVGAEAHDRVSWDALTLMVDCLGTVHSTSVHPDQLPLIRAQTFKYRPPGDQPDAPLIHVRRAADLVPLLQSTVLRHHPVAWHGRPLGDPEEERRILLDTWKE